ncbi:MAG: hypothetical protein KF888_10145 [Nitrosomonas sp.]|nr:hypothetical protein [Nitrosomonas sp.]
MTPQSWITIFNIFSFIGAFLVVISSIGAWYFGNKVDDEKEKKIAELIEGKDELLMKSNNAHEESMEIKRLNNLMLWAMENAGQVRLNRDSTGKITGFVIELAGSAKAETSASGELTVGKQNK